MKSNSSPLKRIRHRLEYESYRLLLAVIPQLPRSWLSRISRLAGWVGPRLVFWEARKARINLDLVYGDSLGRKGRESIVRQSFENMALTALYTFWSKNISRETVDDFVTVSEESWETVRLVKNKGKGAIALLAHYGNWELMGVACGYLDVPPLNVIVRSLKNPLLNELVNRYRCRSGNRVIFSDQAAMKSLRALQRGEVVVMVYDLNVDPEDGGTFAPFLGLPAATTKAAAVLSLKTGAPLVPVVCEPWKDGQYLIQFEAPVDFTPGGDYELDVQQLTELCNQRVEQTIRRNPGPWLWMYKRWRIRPTLEQGRYPDYSKPARALRRKQAGGEA